MADNSKYGSFVPTTNIYDLENINDKELKPEDIKTLLVRLRQTINTISLSNNIKDSGYYVLEEFVNGQQFFKDPALNSTTEKAAAHRQVYRKVINFGALPNDSTKSVAHGLTIDNTWTFTRIYGTASDPVAKSYIGIPFSVSGSGGAIGTGTGTGTGTLNLSTIKWSDTTAPISTTVNTTVTIAAGTSDFIGIEVDATNVDITTGSDRTAFTTCYVVLEYIKE